jgi:pSer/pThr/pTyr-binding forkhead associated (FHA) protein
MSNRLTNLLAAPALRAAYAMSNGPVLVWEAAPSDKASQDLLWVTNPKIKVNGPSNDPLAYRVEKTSKGNAFGLGITLGRATNNDIPVDDPSVSRFHAYFQYDEQSRIWHVVDAESSTGTFIGGERLSPKRPAPLLNGAAFTVGHVELRFFLHPGFEQYFEAWSKGA